MQYRISREQALNTFIKVVSSKPGFEEELAKHPIVLSYYNYLTKDNISEFRNKIKRYHLKHNQNFVVVDNEDNLLKFKTNGIPVSQIVISDRSAILKTSLGKFDEQKLVEALLLKVGDVYKFNERDCSDFGFGLAPFDSIVSELGLHKLDIITASRKVLTELIKLAKQIRTKYGLQVCNKKNMLTDGVFEINESFVTNNHTETLDRYSLYTRYFDLIVYALEVLEYKLKGEIEDPESINELYYRNLSKYCNGFMYSANETDFKLVRSKISIGDTTRIKNLKDYVESLESSSEPVSQESSKQTKLSKETRIDILAQIGILAELSKKIYTEHPEAIDNSKLLTPEINFLEKSYVEQHLSNPDVLKYQEELNKLLEKVSSI